MPFIFTDEPNKAANASHPTTAIRAIFHGRNREEIVSLHISLTAMGAKILRKVRKEYEPILVIKVNSTVFETRLFHNHKNHKNHLNY